MLDTTTAADSDTYVIDNLFTPARQQRVLAFLRDGGWEFGWKSSRKTDRYSFWHRHFAGHRNSRDETQYDCAEELAQTTPLIAELWTLLAADIFAGHTLVRCYANGHAYGSDGTVHTDSKSPRSYTAVYYPHMVWNPSWGGETVVFNPEKTDIIAAVYPQPNRLAVFRGSLPHVARGVARICPVLRITLMFKVERRDDQ